MIPLYSYTRMPFMSYTWYKTFILTNIYIHYTYYVISFTEHISNSNLTPNYFKANRFPNTLMIPKNEALKKQRGALSLGNHQIAKGVVWWKCFFWRFLENVGLWKGNNFITVVSSKETACSSASLITAISCLICKLSKFYLIFRSYYILRHSSSGYIFMLWLSTVTYLSQKVRSIKQV